MVNDEELEPGMGGLVADTFAMRKDRIEQGALKLVRLWTEVGIPVSLPVSRVAFDRLLGTDSMGKALHAPLECLFYSGRKIWDVFFRVVCEPGDQPAYLVPAEEWMHFFLMAPGQQVDQKLHEWYARGDVSFGGVMLDEEMIAELDGVTYPLPPLAPGGYLVMVRGFGWRVICLDCVRRYCKFG